jgi:hypothetical protein
LFYHYVASYFGNVGQRLPELLIRVCEINHVTSQIPVIGGKVEVAMATHGDEDDLLFPSPLAF